MEFLAHMNALSDFTRSRLLLALESHELTVSELCSVLQLPQSTVSRHLKVLGDEGWVISRADGTSRRYRMVLDRLSAPARRLWGLVRDQVSSTPAASQDSRRIQSVLVHRRSKSQEFFSTSAGQWDRLRNELFGNRSDIIGLLGMLDENWTVGDLGCGTGQMTEALAPFVKKVVAVDDSAAMLAAAKKRLAGISNVELRQGDMAALPLEDDSLDAVMLFLVLHYVVEPAQVFSEIRRVLRPGGKLLIVDMMPHDRQDFQQIMGHVWTGFAQDAIERWADEAGLGRGGQMKYHPLPSDSSAKGPTLFAATMRKEVVEVQVEEVA